MREQYSRQLFARWIFFSECFLRVRLYPNNRTVFNTSVGLAANYNNKNYWTINPYFLLSTSYFLGYRTRLNADVLYAFNRNNLEYSNGMVSTSGQAHASFSVGLAYYFF